MTVAIPTEMIDKDGNLTAIEFYDTLGSHLFDVIWDPNDPQDSEHRAQFRKWAYGFVKNKGYEVFK